MKTATVTYAPNGAKPHEVPVEEIVVPDLWHVAMTFEGPTRDMVLDAWHLAHDLRKHAIALNYEPASDPCPECGSTIGHEPVCRFTDPPCVECGAPVEPGNRGHDEGCSRCNS